LQFKQALISVTAHDREGAIILMESIKAKGMPVQGAAVSEASPFSL